MTCVADQTRQTVTHAPVMDLQWLDKNDQVTHKNTRWFRDGLQFLCCFHPHMPCMIISPWSPSAYKCFWALFWPRHLVLFDLKPWLWHPALAGCVGDHQEDRR